jgi:hypothetical protein
VLHMKRILQKSISRTKFHNGFDCKFGLNK